MPQKRRASDPEKQLQRCRRARQQPQGTSTWTAGRPVHLHHRRFRLGQIDADQRHLYAAAARTSTAPPPNRRRTTEIIGLDLFDKVINVDQSPIGRTPRSNPATYTGLLTPIRELFAGVTRNRARAATAGRFSASTSRADAAKPARATA
jgi:excinuclease ABC subunit A